MTAATSEMRNWLKYVIKIPDGPTTDTNQVRDVVRGESLDSLLDFLEFKDEDVKILCSSVRNPGGKITDPNDATRTISNPGHGITAISEKRLSLACYGAKCIIWSEGR